MQATLLKRYKRFLADVRLPDGTELTVHCPNSGAMTSCSEPGRPVIISDSHNPKRKLRYTLEMIRMGRTWVSVHAVKANETVARLIHRQRISELQGYATLTREVAYGEHKRSRLDILLQDDKRPDCYVEIKQSTMRIGQHAAFPDAVTERGRKHLMELTHAVQAGHRAVIFFLVARNDCTRFRPADEVDPAYGAALRQALSDGVEALAYRVRISPRGPEMPTRLPIDLATGPSADLQLRP